MSDQAKCSICGEPMLKGEEMFKYHGYSGGCPKPPLPTSPPPEEDVLLVEIARIRFEARHGENWDRTDDGVRLSWIRSEETKEAARRLIDKNFKNG